MQESKFYVTTPIYYVNDRPHIGHAYTTILADVLARYHRLIGAATHFLTGTDEHGQKVQNAAEKGGITAQEHADNTVVRFQELWKRLEITNDDFIRTTEPRHKVIVRKILQDLFDRGEIYKADYDGWYCVTCERFFTKKDVVDGVCPADGCGRPLDHITESNYFFKMGSYQDWLIRHIKEHPKFIQPDFRRNETLGFLRKDLNDLCISRPKSRLSWGIELPFDSDYVTYVWFDALVNYISAIGYLSDDESFEKWWPANYHLIGKDILTTHTVYWPTMLKAMGLPMPETIFAHGWWLIGRDKMSKTAGNVVDPMEFAERYGVDAFRYFLMAEMTLGQDASFTEEAFVRRYDADLANDLGNMLSRVTKLVNANFDGLIPECGALGSDEESLRDAALAAAATVVESVEKMRPDLGLAALSAAVREANRYLEKRQPWTLAKQGEEKREELGTVLYCAAETLRVVGGMFYPVMPDKMSELREVLGCAPGDPDFNKLSKWGHLQSGARMGKMRSLFPRIGWKSKGDTSTTPPKSAKAADDVPEGVAHIDCSDFARVDLRSAVIKGAEKVEGADKLLKLQVRIGEETRQIVAGIAMHYDPKEIIGKSIVIVANLKPAKIRGIESNGMLLAATSGKGLRLVTVDGDLPSGAKVS